MTDDGNFLRRWSRRKTAVREGKAVDAAPAAVPPNAAVPANSAIPAEAGIATEAKAAAELPPVDSLTIDSDFSPFMQAGVDPALKQEALKKLVRDPRFNVMDGLDVYIDDYSKPDPLPDGWLEKMNQFRNLTHGLEPDEDEVDPLQKQIQQQPVEPDSSPSAQVSRDEESPDSE